MRYYSTVDDYLRDAYEAIDFYATCVRKSHGEPYIAPPWKHTERITRLFEYAINKLTPDYFWCIDEFEDDRPYIESGFLKEEHIDRLKKIISISINNLNYFHRKSLRIESSKKVFTELRVDALFLLRDAHREDNEDDLILNLLPPADRADIFAVVTLVSAYLSYKFYEMQNYEQAFEFIACAQLSAHFSSDSYSDLATMFAITEQNRKRRQRAAKKGAKNRIEAQFKEEIFIPSWNDWQNSDIEYDTQTAFLEEMVKQSMQYFKDRGVEKKPITIRTLQNWLAVLQNP